MDDVNKFKEEGLPSIHFFYSKFTGENISDSDYNHAKNVKYVKIRNKFIEIKYSVSNGLGIFIINYRWFRIWKICRYRRSNGSVLKDTR